MRLRTTNLILPALLLVSTTAGGDTILRQRNVADLNKARYTSVFAHNNIKIEEVDQDVHGVPVVHAQFNGLYSSIGQELSSSQDWSPYDYVTVKMTNKESYPVDFKFIVLLTSDPNNYNNAFTGSFELRANETQRFMFHLNNLDPEPYGMEYLRPVLKVNYKRVISGSKFRNLKTIYHWRISHQETSPSRVTITDLRLIKQDMDFYKMVDKWGQYRERTWDGKVDSDNDFAFRKAKELTYLDANPGITETSGTRKLIAPTSGTGEWETVWYNSKRYLQHPNGRLFWALGVSGVHEGMPTVVEGREDMFTTLPSTGGQFAAAYGEKDGQLVYAPSVRNLIVKYGSDYVPSWASIVKKRLASWGFNTLGIQSAPAFYDGSIPYTTIVYTRGFKTRLYTPHMLWGSMPDPYTSGFRSWMTSHFREELGSHFGRQSFMGTFVDNELSWGNTRSEKEEFNVPRGVLNSPSSQPAKVAFRNQLENRYSSIGALNRAWNTSFSSWSDFLNKRWLPSSFTSSMKSDFRSFLRNFASRYYYEVDAALHDAGNTGLYMGSRFADYTPDVVAAAAKYCNVVSFNFYRTADRIDWDYLATIPRSVIFSEFSYGAFYDGTFGGPAEMASREERTEAITQLLEKAAKCPTVVGALWYCYIDQPITGRYTDGENGALGLVDIADNPHYETVDAFRDFAKRLYSIRT